MIWVTITSIASWLALSIGAMLLFLAGGFLSMGHSQDFVRHYFSGGTGGMIDDGLMLFVVGLTLRMLVLIYRRLP